MEEEFLHPHMKVEMFIECPKVVLYIGIITKEFLEECCILLEKSMYVNVYVALLWLILLAKYLINEFNLKRSKSESCILCRKYGDRKLKLVVLVHVYNLFMAVNTETLRKIKEIIKLKFNIQESRKVRKFLGYTMNGFVMRKFHMKKLSWKKTLRSW